MLHFLYTKSLSIFFFFSLVDLLSTGWHCGVGTRTDFWLPWSNLGCGSRAVGRGGSGLNPLNSSSLSSSSQNILFFARPVFDEPSSTAGSWSVILRLRPDLLWIFTCPLWAEMSVDPMEICLILLTTSSIFDVVPRCFFHLQSSFTSRLPLFPTLQLRRSYSTHEPFFQQVKSGVAFPTG